MEPRKKGFTLVELSISMVFISVLSLAVILTINNTVMAYRRSNTLNQVNTVGMDIVDDMRMAAQSSSAKTLTETCAKLFANESERKKCEDDNAYNFVSVTKYSTVFLNKGTSNEERLLNTPIYGVFCTGTYSYIWNSGYFESNEASFSEKESGSYAKLLYSGGSVLGDEKNPDEPFRLIKVLDKTRSVCIAAIYPQYDNNSDTREYPNRELAQDLFASNVINISNIVDGSLDEDPIYLMASGGENNLALYDLLVSRPAVSPENNSVFYPVSFILGTIDGGINILASGKTCAAPNDYNGDLDYCAINRFSFAARATGE